MADLSRKVLAKWGIGINDAANGVYLPAAYHQGLHTSQYYGTVYDMLRTATSRSEALAVLDALRQALIAGSL
jgi:hypothetical protein